jgi:hypothetical protein
MLHRQILKSKAVINVKRQILAIFYGISFGSSILVLIKRKILFMFIARKK